MKRALTTGLSFGALALAFVGTVGASGSSGPISWSDSVVGTTTLTGSVFGTNCGSGSANAAEEDATLALMDGWAADAVAADFTYLAPVNTPANNTSGDNAVLGFSGVGGVTVTVSRRQVTSASAGDLADTGVGAFSANARFRTTRRLQDCAPRPSDLAVAPAGMTLARTTQYSGIGATRESHWTATTFPSGNELDATLFEFSEPVGAFGVWLGDLETRPPIAAAPGGGVLAVVKLLDAGGNLVASSVITPEELVIDDTICGGVPNNADGLGCGNQATRFVGFVQPAANVSSMIIIVGDDDSCTQTSACDGRTEYLAWMGPLLAVTQPDLAVTKTVDAPLPTAIGDPVSWTITVSNVGEFEAEAGWIVGDDADASVTGLALSGVAAEVDCSAVSSCTGLMAIPPGSSITVTASGTHTAGVAVPVNNVAFVLPAGASRPELIPAGATPAPGDDTSATATNNDADTSYQIAEIASLNIVKSAGGDDANTAPGHIVAPGSALTYTFEVTATGNVPIGTITLSDDNGTPGDVSDDFSPPFIGGDTDSDGMIDPGEVWLYQIDVAAPAATLTNTVTVSGTSDAGTDASDSDLAITSPPVTTTTTSTTSTTVSTSTSAPASTTSTTTSVSTSANPTTTTRPVAVSPSLPVTGGESRWLAMAAIGLVLAGVTLLGALSLVTRLTEDR